MGLSDIVNISISIAASKATRPGFGVPLILAPDCPAGFTERVREYSDADGLAVDFASTTVTSKMAAAIFAQENRPPKVKIGRLALKPTQRWIVVPVVVNSTKYSVKVDGNLVSYTSDGTATAQEIIDGLKAAIDALAIADLTTSNVGPNTSLRVLAGTAGAFHSLEVLDTTLLAVAQDHADPGLATDLAAINLENGAWYTPLFGFPSKACALAIATWAEANEKLYVQQTQDSDVVNLSAAADTGGAQTIAGALKSVDFRTALVYHPRSSAYEDAALAGNCLPRDPGSETWAFKNLATVEATTLTATQRANALAKFVNVYETISGLNITEEGKVSGNEYIDVIRFRDWLRANMAADILEALTKGNKLPFTDGGISVVEGKIRARLKIGVDVGGLAADPPPTVRVPKAADVSASDKAARKLTGVKFDAVLAGAIQAATVSGTITA